MIADCGLRISDWRLVLIERESPRPQQSAIRNPQSAMER